MTTFLRQKLTAMVYSHTWYTTKKMLNMRVHGNRRGRPKKRWLHNITDYLKEYKMTEHMGTGHNGDESRTATTKTATHQNGNTPKRRQQWSKRRQLESKRRQALVKTATSIGQNGEEFWLKRRQPLVKTATVVSQRRRNLVGQNGDTSQSRCSRLDYPNGNGHSICRCSIGSISLFLLIKTAVFELLKGHCIEFGVV